MKENRIKPNLWHRSAFCFFLFFTIILFTQCEKFPSNPEDNPEESPWVEIRHVATEYVNTQTSVTGLAAKKVNLLKFEIQANYFEAAALEVFGRVVLEGPPYEREHNLYFRTDKLLQLEAGNCICLDNIQPESPYEIIRSKFPTNEYSPFQGDQGKVKEVIITHVVAYDTQGNGTDIALAQKK